MHALLLLTVHVCHAAERWARVASAALVLDAVHAVHALLLTTIGCHAAGRGTQSGFQGQ